MKTLNILLVLQQSIYNNENKWLSGDSGINMYLDLFEQMYENNPTIHFYCLIAPREDFADLPIRKNMFGCKHSMDYSDLYNKSNVTFIPYNFPVNAFTNRFAFDPAYFMQTYNDIENIFDTTINIVWNNIIELTRNIKTTLWQNNKKPKFISCNYWLDAPSINQGKVDKDISYDIRQADGFECSDLCVFTCESTKNAWEENAKFKFHPDFIENILNKSVIWDFGYLQKNLNQSYNYNITKFDKPTILFLNRLSGINYTHHMEFINAVNELWDERQDFQVFFTNPSNKVSTEWLKENVKPYVELLKTPLSRAEYFKLLHKSHISCHLFLIELYGGCAHREISHINDTIQICPQINEYERIHGKEYEFYCKKDFSDLKEVLSKAIDAQQTFYKKPQDMINRNYESSFEYVIKYIVLEDLKKLCV